VRTRLAEPRRVRRIALGVLALASLAGAPCAAQESSSGALGLRGVEPAFTVALDTPNPALSPPDATNLGPGAPDDANPAAKKKKLLAKKAPKSAPLGVYRGAQRLGLRGGAPDLAPGETPPPTIAAIAPPAPRRRPPEVDDKPFDPLGLKVGDLKLTPYVEESVGFASNPASAAGPQKGSAFETTEAGLALQSDWSRNDLHGALKGAYTDYFTAHQDDAPSASGTLDGRLDATRDLSFDAEGRFSVGEQTLASLGLVSPGAVAATVHPLVETFGATLGGAQKFGNLTLALHGTLDATQYQNATLGGVVEDLSSDNFNDWGLRARASYLVSPAFSPFVEVDIDARRYQAAIDYNGYARDSQGVQALAGATLAFTHQLTGEASLGYGARAYQDARLPDMSSPVIDASLIWSATPLTTITAKAQTSLADTTTAGASGAVTRAYTIDVAHALTPRITLGASAGYTSDNYVGVTLHDATTSLGLRGEYHLSRELALKASATRQDYVSSAPNSNYIANVFMLGLRLQP
jgi:hypothetical protein